MFSRIRRTTSARSLLRAGTLRLVPGSSCVFYCKQVALLLRPLPHVTLKLSMLKNPNPHLLAFCLFLAVPLAAQPNSGEQIVFDYRNDPLPRPVSPAVLKLLLTRKDVKQAFAESDPSLGKDPARVFTAAPIGPINAAHIDLIVEGIFIAPASDRSAPFPPEPRSRFWVIRFADTNPQVVFATGYGFTSLELEFPKNGKTPPTITVHTPSASPEAHIEETYRFRQTTYHRVKREFVHESAED